LTRLGTQKPSSRLQPMLLDIFKIPQFNGMIGGKPSKALYFVGADGEDLIYLDPHYVQSSSNRKNLPTQLESYFCQGLRTIQYSQI
jgi:cysteine protease ATG4